MARWTKTDLRWRLNSTAAYIVPGAFTLWHLFTLGSRWATSVRKD
jgi:hypothetical protein